MFRRDKEPENSNFWVSYADLMAGLLFVFILLIGTIVSKSILLREDLYKKEKNLDKTQKVLKDREKSLEKSLEKISFLRKSIDKREKELKKKRRKIDSQQAVIEKQKQKISLQEEEVAKLHALLSELKEEIKSKNRRIEAISTELATEKKRGSALDKAVEQKDAILTLKKNELKLKERELEKLNQLLLARNAKIDSLNKKIIVLQNLNMESNTTLSDKERKLQKYINRVVVLSARLTKKEDELRLKDEKLSRLLEALDEKKSDYEDLLKKLKSQKARIKSLTGIQLKVIAALKETLGERIEIDKKTGALRFSSKILFDRGSSKLKESAKRELRDTFEKYIGALVSNEAIRPHLDRIIVEGHTDSDGGYMYNLKLSQQRALAVMNYLLTLPIAKEYDLKRYLLASGRSYEDRIMKNGREDKEASRRIEIKFSLKNRDAMYEIERILDEKRR